MVSEPDTVAFTRFPGHCVLIFQYKGIQSIFGHCHVIFPYMECLSLVDKFVEKVVVVVVAF